MCQIFKNQEKIHLIAFLFCALLINAQEPINTDRPDQSDGTYTLTKNKFQLENGFTFIDDDVRSEDYFASDYMLRYGLTTSTEIRLVAELGNQDGQWQMNPLGLSIKQALVTNKGIVPSVTAVGYIYLPKTASIDNRPSEVPASFLLAFENELSNRLSLGYNIGMEYDGDDYDENWVSTAALEYSLSKKISFFIEYYGSYKKDDDPFDDDYENGIDGGVLWGINPNFQIDLALGKALNERDLFSITAGIAYRFK